MQPVGLSVVVGLHHGGVTHPGTEGGFTEKPLHGRTVAAQFLAQHLHRAHAALLVVGPIDGRRAPLADAFLEVVARDGGAGEVFG